jgi:CheY-like chemotaxis protein
MKTVLIVDDDEDYREALDAALTLKGFGVRQAASGRAALALLSGGAPLPDAMLVDLMMPAMDGWQFLAAVERDPTLAGIPSAVVSAARCPEGLPRSVTVLPKPCGLADLLHFLSTLAGPA